MLALGFVYIKGPHERDSKPQGVWRHLTFTFAVTKANVMDPL